jgi:acetyl esterase/lipase
MSTEKTYPPPPFDPEVEPALVELLAVRPKSNTVEDLVARRDVAGPSPLDEGALAARRFRRQDRRVPGVEGGPDVTVSIFTKEEHHAGGPGFYWVHGGGMVFGDRLAGVENVLGWIDVFGGVGVSVEYRLAPEHPDPAPVHDCYTALAWMAAEAEELGFDAGRLVIAGASGGGGVAAGTVLLARDRGGPPLAAQVLIYPMIDDRNDTVSSLQMAGRGVWDRVSNDAGWDAVLGDRRRTDLVGIYASPSRATDLTGLPPTYLECGSAETFRDEDVAYASGIWKDGGVADLHVWAGGYHGVDRSAPTTAIAAGMRETRLNFLGRVLRAK